MKTLLLRLMVVAAVGMFGMTAIGCEGNEGPLEEAGRRADEAVEEAGERMQESGEEIEEEFDEAGEEIDEDVERE